MIRNQKGMTGLEVGLVIGLLFLLFPVIKPFIGSSDGQKITQNQSTIKTIKPAEDSKGNPVYVKDAQGNVSPLMEEVQTVNNLSSQVTPPKPFMERVIMWFVHLGFLGLVLALACPSAAIAIWVFIAGRFKKLRAEADAHKGELDDLKIEAKRIVVSVEKALSQITDPFLKDKIYTELSKTQDGSTKALVTELKGV